MVSDLAVTSMPRTWQASILTMLDKSRGTGYGALRLVGLVSLMQRAVAKCMLQTVGSDLHPQRVNAYACRKGGSVDRAIMPSRLAIEKCREWGESLHVLQLDRSDGFGSVDYMFM